MSIEKQIVEIISSSSYMEPEQIKLEDTLRDLGFDSFKTVELVVSLEDYFGITFEDSDLDISKLLSVDDAINLVKKYT